MVNKDLQKFEITIGYFVFCNINQLKHILVNYTKHAISLVVQ